MTCSPKFVWDPSLWSGLAAKSGKPWNTIYCIPCRTPWRFFIYANFFGLFSPQALVWGHACTPQQCVLCCLCHKWIHKEEQSTNYLKMLLVFVRRWCWKDLNSTSLMANEEEASCGYYVVPLLHWTPTFEWYMGWFVMKTSGERTHVTIKSNYILNTRGWQVV